MIALAVPWILLSVLVGWVGRNGRGGFWGSLFFSLLFTPVVGFLAVMVAGPSRALVKIQARMLADAKQKVRDDARRQADRLLELQTKVSTQEAEIDRLRTLSSGMPETTPVIEHAPSG